MYMQHGWHVRWQTVAVIGCGVWTLDLCTRYNRAAECVWCLKPESPRAR